MGKRAIGPLFVQTIGLGCMSFSHAYGRPPAPEDAAHALHHALDLGYDFLDTAALYGFGANEILIGQALAKRRDQFVLASKCGMTGVDGKRVIDGRPETLLSTVEASLTRLKTDVIDLYYLHRLDKTVPIEESVGALSRMVEAGKVRAIGLSEVSASTLVRAHAVHPIAALQTEYSPWSREAEIAVLAKTRELGVAFVAFSPLARGFLAGAVTGPALLAPGDLRLSMPRFQGQAFQDNLDLLKGFRIIARDADLTPAQLALAWGLAKHPHLVAIPGTTSRVHLEENFAARHVSLAPEVVALVDLLINHHSVSGERYPPAAQADIDTEQFATVAA